jgi:hypothetical protein
MLMNLKMKVDSYGKREATSYDIWWREVVIIYSALSSVTFVFSEP